MKAGYQLGQPCIVSFEQWRTLLPAAVSAVKYRARNNLPLTHLIVYIRRGTSRAVFPARDFIFVQLPHGEKSTAR